MQEPYLHVVVMLHAAFAAVFFFLHRQSPSRFASRFALCWTLEGVRAAILLPALRSVGGSVDQWFCVSDVLCFFATWALVAGCAELAGIKLPRWIAPIYVWGGIALVIFNRFGLPLILQAGWNVPREKGVFYGVLTNLFIMFEPAGLARVAVTFWLFGVWKKTRLPGAFFAGVFCIPYAVVALVVPLQFIAQYQPDWILLVWCLRVLSFSIGLVMLMFNLQQATVARSAASLAAAQSLAKIGSWELVVATKVATWSAEMFRLYGRDPAAGALSYAEFIATIHPDDREGFQRDEAIALAYRNSSQHQFRIIRPDGRVRWIQGRNTPLFDRAGHLERMVGVEQDITDRKRAEARVELQHAVTRALAEAEPIQPTLRKILSIIGRRLEFTVGIYWTMDRAIGALRCGEVWEATENGAPALVTTSRTAVVTAGMDYPGEALATRASVFWPDASTQGKSARQEAAALAGLSGGSAFPVMLRTEVLGVIELFSVRPRREDDEVSALFAALGAQLAQCIERQRLDEQYRQSQKMEAVGTLAGGIAHDFNNILTAITGYCELARLEMAPDAAVEAHLEAVQQGARRATELVRQIMAFSRRQEQLRSPTRLETIVEEAINLLRATIPATIEIRTSYEEDLPRVLADATSIHQVVVNLGTNASHAMKARPGRLEVKVESLVLDGDDAKARPGLGAGRYVRLTVADNGHGMNAATLGRIFEPFFTTKGPGEGTGLGLSVVHGIMQSHEGAVFVYSQPEEGTKFSLYFPAHVALDDEAKYIAAAPVTPGEGQQILYVEDEGSLGQMGRKILERLNYAVDVHSDPLNALAAFRADPSGYHLVITDLTMPAMTGLELAREILVLRPGLPIILMTGYAASLDSEQTRAEGIRELLLKPLSVDSLGGAVHRALHAAESVA